MRYLFGPLRAAYADSHVSRTRQAGECICFSSETGGDVQIALNDSWDDVLARLPAGVQLDAIVLVLDYTAIPRAIWTQPAPIIGLAPDWDLLWHLYRRQLRRCDLVLTDSVGAERMRQDGIGPVQAANLAGCPRRNA